jgi:hypothetical protein
MIYDSSLLLVFCYQVSKEIHFSGGVGYLAAVSTSVGHHRSGFPGGGVLCVPAGASWACLFVFRMSFIARVIIGTATFIKGKTHFYLV